MRRVTIPASLEEDEKAALRWSSSLTLSCSSLVTVIVTLQLRDLSVIDDD